MRALLQSGQMEMEDCLQNMQHMQVSRSRTFLWSSWRQSCLSCPSSIYRVLPLFRLNSATCHVTHYIGYSTSNRYQSHKLKSFVEPLPPMHLSLRGSNLSHVTFGQQQHHLTAISYHLLISRPRCIICQTWKLLRYGRLFQYFRSRLLFLSD